MTLASIMITLLLLVVIVDISSMKINTSITNNKAFNQIKRSTLLFTLSGMNILNMLSNPVIVHANTDNDKLINQSPAVLKKIVADDITVRQALYTADFTRSIYSDKCTFQDEVDIYPIDKYIKGTKQLFNPLKSHVDLVGDVVSTNDDIQFNFKERLAFNIPFLYPTVDLTGKVVLTRGQDEGGLIIRSREYWNESIINVLKTLKI